jgi:hypothetical protein
MKSNFFKSLLLLIRFLLSQGTYSNSAKSQPWIVNHPNAFQKGNTLGKNLTDDSNMIDYAKKVDEILFKVKNDPGTDGEVIDALEHFFWGKLDGLAIELGALGDT